MSLVRSEERPRLGDGAVAAAHERDRDRLRELEMLTEGVRVGPLVGLDAKRALGSSLDHRG